MGNHFQKHLIMFTLKASEMLFSSHPYQYHNPNFKRNIQTISEWSHRLHTANSKCTPMATMFTTVHRSNLSVPKLIFRQYTHEHQCTLKGELWTQTVQLTNYIASPCSHNIMKTDELTCVHADWSIWGLVETT